MSSQLSDAYAQFALEVSKQVGYGSDISLLPAAQLAEVQSILRSGVRQFYYPPPLQLGQPAHQWSFLRPITTQACVAATATYTLPITFGALIGEMTFAVADSGYRSIKIVSEETIRKLKQGAGTAPTGAPVYGAIYPAATAESGDQRFTLLLYPTPDAAYTLTYRYAMIVDNALDATDSYPFGSAPHAETILESCLAIAEERLDDTSGLHAAKFRERLAASIAHDKQHEPAYYGYNGDRSGPLSNSRYSNDLVCTVNGITPD